jgi:hypothetical protein
LWETVPKPCENTRHKGAVSIHTTQRRIRWMRNLKCARQKRPWTKRGTIPVVSWADWRKSRKPCQDSRCPDLNLNGPPPECEYRVQSYTKQLNKVQRLSCQLLQIQPSDLSQFTLHFGTPWKRERPIARLLHILNNINTETYACIHAQVGFEHTIPLADRSNRVRPLHRGLHSKSYFSFVMDTNVFHQRQMGTFVWKQSSTPFVVLHMYTSKRGFGAMACIHIMNANCNR